MDESFREQLASMTPEQVASHFIVMMMPDIFSGQDSRSTRAAARAAKGVVAASAPAAAPRAPVAPEARAPRSVKPAAPAPQPQVEVAAEASEPAVADVKVDLFGDVVVEKKSEKKKTSTLDQPPRSRKKPLDEDEIVSMLEEPPTFGVVKEQAREPRAGRFGARREGVSRSQAQFRSGPRDDRFARPSRPDAAAPRGNDRFDRPSRPARAPRFDGGFERKPLSRPQRQEQPRAAAPMNLGKPPKHDAGPARTARLGETGGLNRRARRALLFGRPLDGANESTH
jgi:hypothetical protein